MQRNEGTLGHVDVHRDTRCLLELSPVARECCNARVGDRLAGRSAVQRMSSSSNVERGCVLP